MRHFTHVLLVGIAFSGVLMVCSAELPEQDEGWDHGGHHSPRNIGEVRFPGIISSVEEEPQNDNVPHDLDSPLVQALLPGSLSDRLRAQIQGIVWEQCDEATPEERESILRVIQEYPEDRLESVSDLLKRTDLLGHFQEAEDIHATLQVLKVYSPAQLAEFTKVLCLPYLMGIIHNIPQLQLVLNTLHQFKPETLAVVTSILDRHSCIEKCLSFASVIYMLDCFSDYTDGHLQFIANGLAQYRTFENYSSSDHIILILNNLARCAPQNLDHVLTLLNMSPLVACFQSAPEDLERILQRLIRCSPDQLKIVLKLLESGRILEKYRPRTRAVSQTSTPPLAWRLVALDLLEDLVGCSVDQLQATGEFLGAHPILNHCQDGAQIVRLFRTLRPYTCDQLKEMSNLLTQYPILERCRDGEEMIGVLYELREYSAKQLENVLSLCKEYRIWERCEHGWQVGWILLRFKMDTYARLESILTNPEHAHFFEALQDGYQIGLLLGKKKQYPSMSLECLLAALKSYAPLFERFKDEKRFNTILSIVNRCSLSQMNAMVDLLDHYRILPMCHNIEQVIHLLQALDGHSVLRLKGIVGVLERYGIMKKYTEAQNFIDTFQALRLRNPSYFHAVLEVLTRHSILQRYSDGDQISRLIWFVTGYTPNFLESVLGFLDAYQFLDKFYNVDPLAEVLMAFRTHDSHSLKEIIRILGDYDIVSRCQHGYELNRFLRLSRDYSLEYLERALVAMGRFFNSESQLSVSKTIKVLEQFRKCDPDHLERSLQILKSYSFLEDCRKQWEVEGVFEVLKGFSADEYAAVPLLLDRYDTTKEYHRLLGVFCSLRQYKADQIRAVSELLNQHRVLDAYLSDCVMENLLRTLRTYSVEQIQATSKFLREQDFILTKCQDEMHMSQLFRYFTDVYRHPNWAETLQKTCSWLKHYQEAIEHLHARALTAFLNSLQGFNLAWLEDERIRLPERITYLPVYLTALNVERYRLRCQDAICRLIQNFPDEREDLLSVIVGFLGEQSPLAQHFLHQAIEYDNAQNPDGSLAVYQEMLAKSQEVVDTTSVTQRGLRLNDAFTREPRPLQPIHVPLDVWQRLFTAFKAAIGRGELPHIEASLKSDLEALEDALFVRDLLDPQGSSAIPKERPISSHSMMLRKILHTIDLLLQHDPDEAVLRFSQLVVNMTTCAMGKLNGIMHFYTYMSQDKALGEPVLGSQSLIQQIMDHFKEEMRRVRERIIMRIVYNLTDRKEPHDIYYVRGIIGHETGLFFKDEVPGVDLYAHIVLESLRKVSKQQLLDLLYQHYTVDLIVDHFHMYINGKARDATGGNTETRIVLPIINELLREEAYDIYHDRYIPEFVTLDAEGNPMGLTRKAAESLLLKTGFLVKSA